MILRRKGFGLLACASRLDRRSAPPQNVINLIVHDRLERSPSGYRGGGLTPHRQEVSRQLASAIT